MADLEVVEIDGCFAKGGTQKALLVEMPDGDEAWIPIGQIEADSEVFEPGHKGKLVVSLWIAKQKHIEGLGKRRYVGP